MASTVDYLPTAAAATSWRPPDQIADSLDANGGVPIVLVPQTLASAFGAALAAANAFGLTTPIVVSSGYGLELPVLGGFGDAERGADFAMRIESGDRSAARGRGSAEGNCYNRLCKCLPISVRDAFTQGGAGGMGSRLYGAAAHVTRNGEAVRRRLHCHASVTSDAGRRGQRRVVGISGDASAVDRFCRRVTG